MEHFKFPSSTRAPPHSSLIASFVQSLLSSMPLLCKAANTVALVPSPVESLPGAGIPLPEAPSLPILHWFMLKFITNITTRTLLYDPQSALSATTPQLIAEGVQEHTAHSPEDTDSNTIPPPIVRPRTRNALVALVQKRGI
ncbi:hypothetical protein M407DRAFT_5695 [Tulasnella calospora MUT 4182]|uniref:Uncharacterized protein n=1 Tax=Tulasnella calospora MUT 4182 TaxID=1051891 RepID=A0A0C3L951_9AGAM|nr:hypothetical protein M407DRAFT_5695 [Tulasnella calospora MUT 4182]